MIGRIVLVVSVALAAPLLTSADAPAQDVPGIEICTVEKTMERRTSCLQSNVDFLQKTIAKLAADHQQKLDAANRQIESLKSAVASLQKIVDELHAAQKKAAEDQAKNVRNDKALSKDQRNTALQGIRSETENSIRSVFGEKGFDSYQNQPGAYWLKGISPDPKPPKE